MFSASIELLTARLLGTVLVLGLLAACSGTPEDPEARLRQWLADAEIAVEARSLKQTAGLISQDYRDESGRTRRDLVRLLLGHFHRHRQIHLLTRIDDLSVDEGASTSRVRLYVAMAAVPLETVEGLASINADYHRLDLQLRQEEGQWRLLSAAWHRAALKDLLPL